MYVLLINYNICALMTTFINHSYIILLKLYNGKLITVLVLILKDNLNVFIYFAIDISTRLIVR